MRKNSKALFNNFRLYVFFGFIFLVWAGLWSFNFYIQIMKSQTLRLRAKNQHWKVMEVVGERGDILSRDREILAKSIVVKSVFASPNEMDLRQKKEVAFVLSKILRVSKRYIISRLRNKSSFVWIKRKLDDETAFRIKEASLPGVYLIEETKRIYPQGSMLGQLLGFVGVDNKGLEGLEYKFDRYLSGEKKKYLVFKDGLQHTLFAPDQLSESVKGEDLILTIDTTVQAITEKALKESVDKFNANYGMALVIKVSTGEILAWAQYPFFNPNRYYQYYPSVWRNRIALDEFEPGSTIKPLLVTSAIEKGVCKPNSIFFCENGRWSFMGHVIRDTHKYGWLSVNRIIRYSSNICSGKIGLKLGKKAYYDFLKKLGFGEKTGLPLPGESKGSLRPYNIWKDFELATMSFGQGFSVTLLQLAKAYLCLANKGVVKPLVLIKSPAQQVERGRRIFSEKTSEQVLSMLMGVVEDGTGQLARISGLNIGGKTGTAQKATKYGYTNKYTASFVALVPALNPKYLIVVVIDEPKKAHYGGVVAAPAAKYIAKELYVSKAGDRFAFTTPVGKIFEFTSKCYASQDRPLNFKLQYPKTKGLKIKSISKVAGMDVKSAVKQLLEQGIVPKLKGKGVFVVRQTRQKNMVVLYLGDKGDVRKDH